MNYQGALEYINSFTDYEKLTSMRLEPFDLGRIERLLARLGDPHLTGRVFHVAGTKGKGSTAAMIASVLGAQGYRTGLFSSPHLHSFRERIRVNGQPILESDLVALLQKVRPLVEEMHRDGALGCITTFELTTLLAFLYFSEKEVDFQVIEVGLGGRLDATNVVRPLVAVITSISLDHTSILGTTLWQIAMEKAGIIKPGTVVVTAPQEPEAEEVIRLACNERGARLVMLGKDVCWLRQSASLEGQTFLVRTPKADYRLRIPLLGQFQCENAALAVSAIEEARSLGIEISPRSTAQGLAKVSWPGRMHVLQHQPLLLADGAHNVHSAAVLRETIKQDLPYHRCILVLGVSIDKDTAGIVREFNPLADAVVATRSRHPRSAPPEVIAREFGFLEKESRIAGDVPGAIETALELASPDDLVLVTGSLFVVAEALEWAGAAELLDGG